MNHDTHSNPFVSFISGSILSITGYAIEHGPVFDFGLDFLKVCFFGIVGGICGKIGAHIYIKYLRRKNHDTNSK